MLSHLISWPGRDEETYLRAHVHPLNQSVSIHETDDFARLHVENAGLDSDALRRAVHSHGLGRANGSESIDLRLGSLLALVGRSDAQRQAEFDDMISFAAANGWMPDAQHVRVHVVPIPAIKDLTTPSMQVTPPK